MSTSSRPTARLGCEQLEARENPVGNVTTFISNGQLFVIGDVLDNAVSTQQDQFGNIIVIGVNGTLVNGQSAVVIGPFIPLDAIFVGGGGNDQIDVAGLFVSRQLTVATGGGTDLVQLRGVSANFITVDLGAGNDTLIALNMTARTGATLHGNAGFDVFLGRNVFAGSFFFHDGFDQFV